MSFFKNVEKAVKKDNLEYKMHQLKDDYNYMCNNGLMTKDRQDAFREKRDEYIKQYKELDK